VFTILDPELQLQQLDAVQREVSELLAHGVNPAPVAENAAPLVETAATPETPAATAP
jgi:hypothetical protein